MPSVARLPLLCAEGARQVAEPLFSTASRVDLWVLLEVPGAWPDEVDDAIESNPDLQRALQPALKAVPRSRLLFIKGASRGLRDKFAFYVAITDEIESRLYRFEVNTYADLAEIDLFGVLAEEERYLPFRERRPLYLVCTHGTHDRCCAKFGFPTYLSLAGSRPECVWQSSHVGGDRFAANVVCLPDGIYYGHVEPDEHGAFLESTGAGQLYSARWRGRSSFPPAVQAAEYFLRQANGETGVSQYRLWTHQRRGSLHEVTFLSEGAGTLHCLRVEPTILEGSRALTCGATEAKPVSSYRLLQYQSFPFTPETVTAGHREYLLRPAAMRDYGFIYRLRRETLARYLGEIGLSQEEHAPFFARFDVTRHRLICQDAEPVGAVSVLEREEGLHLANLHLLPAHQSQGLGSALVRQVQRQAEATGQRVITRVLKVNPARAFYERLGFRLQEEQGVRARMVWEPPSPRLPE